MQKFISIDLFADFGMLKKPDTNEPVSGNRDIQPFMPFITNTGNTFLYFERLPVKYNEKLFQYEYRNFAFSDWSLEMTYKIAHPLLKIDSNEIIQVF